MSQIPSTKAAFRNQLPLPHPADEAMGHGGELEAVDALFTAYMALNAAGAGTLPVQDSDYSPMSLTSQAASAALARIAGVGTRGANIIWREMCNNSSGASWNYHLWRKGDI